MAAIQNVTQVYFCETNPRRLLYVLQDLAQERFDPTKYLGAFRRGPPEWLNTLIKDRRGRQLIYELSATHRNSLLLNYAIQKILKEVGAEGDLPNHLPNQMS